MNPDSGEEGKSSEEAYSASMIINGTKNKGPGPAFIYTCAVPLNFSECYESFKDKYEQGIVTPRKISKERLGGTDDKELQMNVEFLDRLQQFFTKDNLSLTGRLKSPLDSTSNLKSSNYIEGVLSAEFEPFSVFDSPSYLRIDLAANGEEEIEPEDIKTLLDGKIEEAKLTSNYLSYIRGYDPESDELTNSEIIFSPLHEWRGEAEKHVLNLYDFEDPKKVIDKLNKIGKEKIEKTVGKLTREEGPL